MGQAHKAAVTNALKEALGALAIVRRAEGAGGPVETGVLVVSKIAG